MQPWSTTCKKRETGQWGKSITSPLTNLTRLASTITTDLPTDVALGHDSPVHIHASPRSDDRPINSVVRSSDRPTFTCHDATIARVNAEDSNIDLIHINDLLAHFTTPSIIETPVTTTEEVTESSHVTLPPFPSCPSQSSKTADKLLARPNSSKVLIEKYPDLTRIYDTVRSSGIPNYRGAQLPIPSGLNINQWLANQHKFSDKSLIDFLRYGFPASYEIDSQPICNLSNHSSALSHKTHVEHYLHTELGFNALLGPFDTTPFDEWCRTNPLMTRPKQDTDKRRVILDLSFPAIGSVNAGIPSNELDSCPFKLTLPSPHTLANRMRLLGKGCHPYKIDLSRAYRQLRSCPLDWPLLGVKWDEKFFIDTAIPFGLRHGASACQRTTEAVAEIANHDVGATPHPYIDDTSGAALPDEATIHYDHILLLMSQLGLTPNTSKCSPPSTTLSWIGVFFNSITMSMHISADKVHESANLCVQFLGKANVTHKYMEKLMGKIFHAIKCCEGARRFTSRLLQLMSVTSHTASAPISQQARLDAAWLAAFLPGFNGTTLIKNTVADYTVEVDSCLTGGGGLCSGTGYFSLDYPVYITKCHFSIASLECLNLLIAVRLWITDWAGKHVLIFSDNWGVVCAIQSGRASDPLIQSAMRELWWLAALHDVEFTVRHKPGAQLVHADALSRLSTVTDTASKFHRIV